MPVRSLGLRLLPLTGLLLLAACQAPLATPAGDAGVPGASVTAAPALSVRMGWGYHTLAATAGYTAADVTRLTLALFEVPDPAGAPETETPVLDGDGQPIVKTLTAAGTAPVTLAGLTPGKTYRLKAEAFGADGLISLPAQADAVFPASGTTAVALSVALKPRAVAAAVRGNGVTLLPGGFSPTGATAIAAPARTWTWPRLDYHSPVPATTIPAEADLPSNEARDPVTGNTLIATRVDTTLYMHLYGPNGQPAGPRRVVAGGVASTIEAAVGYNAARGEFLIAWGDRTNPVRMQRVDRGGSPIGGVTTLMKDGAPLVVSAMRIPRLTYNPVDREFFLSTRDLGLQILRLSDDGRWLQSYTTGNRLDFDYLCDGFFYSVVMYHHRARFDALTRTFYIHVPDCLGVVGTFALQAVPQ